MNWSYRGSWLETTPPHATRVCRRARPRDTTLLHIVAAVPGPPPHHGFSTKTACDQASTPGSGLGLNAGSGDSRRPLSSVRGPRALRAAPGGGVQAAGPCKCLFSRFFFLFVCLVGFFLFFFLIIATEKRLVERLVPENRVLLRRTCPVGLGKNMEDLGTLELKGPQEPERQWY